MRRSWSRLVAVVLFIQSQGASIPGVIGALGFSTLAIALISCWLLPETVIKAVLRTILKLIYRIEVHGAENMPQPGERAVVVVNHVSWLDGLLLAVFLPGKPVFAVNSLVVKLWWIQPALKLFRAFPVDPTNPMSAKSMVKAVRGGNTLVIFPEGRITVTGALMKIFDGPGMVADKADAPIVPGAHRWGAVHALLLSQGQGAAADLPADQPDHPAAAPLRRSRAR